MRALVQRVSSASVRVDGEPITAIGMRPSFTAAASAEQAGPLYETACELLGAAHGVFGVHMDVEMIHPGPVTLMVEVGASGRLGH